MPLKHIIIILSLVGLGAVIKPDWTMIFVWIGGMALLWLMTGQWTSPPSQRKTATDADGAAVESEHIRPLDASMEADDLDDLARMDGEPPAQDAADTAPGSARSDAQ